MKHTNSNERAEVSWVELFETISSKKWLILLCALSTCVCLYFVSRVVPKMYQVTVTLAPATDVPGGGRQGAAGALGSQLSGLTSLIGFSGSGGGGMREISIATLKSELLVEKYIRENDLLPDLFGSDWDQVQKQWRTHDLREVPTVWRGGQYFQKDILKVLDTPKTGLVTLTITWKDPKVAARWANGLVEMTNGYLREKAIAESERNVAFLKEEVSKTNVVGLQQSLYALMQQEIEKHMLALGSDEYALKVVDPAVPPEKAWSPRPILWAVSGFLIGALLSLAAVIAVADWRRVTVDA